MTPEARRLPEHRIKLGYALSSEEHAAPELVAQAAAAEEAGFEFALVSDHYHPWTERQGQASFVWSTLGAIAMRTHRLTVGTGVTCPMIRLHPALVAQASATVATLMPDRFFLGVGTGENLNEHILGDRWPASDQRREMLAEAVDIIRELWRGDIVTYRGVHYTVENAKLYSRPESPPRLMVAASGERAAELAGRIGDGLISTAPVRELVEIFDRSRAEAGRGAGDAPRFGRLAACWAGDEARARRVAREWWPSSVLHGELSVELPSPAVFEQATRDVTEVQLAGSIVCGPGPARHDAVIEAFNQVGFDHVYGHRVGPEQEGFLRADAADVLPHWAASPATRCPGTRVPKPVAHTDTLWDEHPVESRMEQRAHG